MSFEFSQYRFGQQPSWGRMEKTFALGGMGCWRLVRSDDNEILFDAHDTFLTVIGVRREEVPKSLAKFLDSFFAPEEARRTLDEIRTCFEGQSPGFSFEHALRPADRPPLWLRTFGEVEERDDCGQVVLVYGCSQNIQEQHENRRQLEIALRDNEIARAAYAREHDRLSTIIDAAALGTWEWNVVTDAVRFNNHSLGMIGLTEEEFGDRMDNWVERAEVEDMDKARQAEDEHYAGLRPFYEAVFKMRHKEGRTVWVQSRGRLVERTPEGDPLRIIGVCLDVSKAKEDAQALAAKQEQLDLVIKSAQIGIWDWDLEAGNVILNETYTQMLGFASDELSLSPALRLSLMHPEDEAKAQPLIQAVIAGREDTYECEMRMRRKDGGYVWTYEIGRAVARDDSGRATRLVGVHFDFSERKNYEEALLAREAAEESTRAKSEFLANMSHEIRTPMNAVLGLLHLALEAEGLGEVHRDYLSKAEGAAKSLLRIINDILDFSKIEAGKLEMERVEFCLPDVLSGVADMVAARAQQKGLEFLVQAPAETPAGLVGDPVRLTQIISNLAGNAVKFTDKGQVAVKVETVSQTGSEVRLKFLVEDTGVGLTPDQINHLFASFSQADASITRRYGGTGLGLVISKRLVEMMGGEIWVESQYGQGSIFGFTANFGLHSSPRKYLEGGRDFAGLKALVVDDNAVALEIIRDGLKSLGFKVAGAASGREALALIDEWRSRGDLFDLIIIDWMMPEMDGIETIKRLNAIDAPDKPPVVIMATAYNRDEVLGLARDAGIRSVLTKPVSPSTMMAVLTDIFGRKTPCHNRPQTARERDQALTARFTGSKVLLAEDNEVNQLVASRILKNAGFMVDIADNGLKAVEMVRGGNYDLVLMDIQMPEMDGLSATREIRSTPGLEKLPVIAMTAHAMSGDREQSLAAGMNDHVNKPINLNELFGCLSRWLEAE